MNQSTKLRSCFTFLTMLCVVLLLVGCLPLPYRNPTSAEVRGKVLNAYTGKPIEGAQIALLFRPKHATKTDNLGNFRLSASYQWHLFVTIQLAACPPTEDRFDSTIYIQHPEYTETGMHVTTNHEYFLMPTNSADFVKRGQRPVYSPPPVPRFYSTNYVRTNSSFRMSGTNRAFMTNRFPATNSFK